MNTEILGIKTRDFFFLRKGENYSIPGCLDTPAVFPPNSSKWFQEEQASCSQEVDQLTKLVWYDRYGT